MGWFADETQGGFRRRVIERTRSPALWMVLAVGEGPIILVDASGRKIPISVLTLVHIAGRITTKQYVRNTCAVCILFRLQIGNFMTGGSSRNYCLYFFLLRVLSIRRITTQHYT